MQAKATKQRSDKKERANTRSRARGGRQLTKSAGDATKGELVRKFQQQALLQVDRCKCRLAVDVPKKVSGGAWCRADHVSFVFNKARRSTLESHHGAGEIKNGLWGGVEEGSSG